MKKNTLLCMSAVAAASMLFACPVMAKEFKTADGNITINLPNDSWYEVIDPEAEFVFTNGVDIISADKYDPDEKVEVARNDEYYNAVLQLSYAYSDQLIVLTAQVSDATSLAEVYEAVTSIKFSGISADNETKKDLNNYTVSDTNMTLYVNAKEGLNLRESFSVTSNVLTTIPHGSEVHVTGIVKLDGKDAGWDRIEYQGTTGYVSAANLISNQPSDETPYTFEQIADQIDYTDTMYLADGTPVKVYVLKNGPRIDMNGHKVVGVADGACQMYDGTIIYAFNPTTTSLEEWMGVNESSELDTAAQYAQIRNDIVSSIDLYYADGSWQTFGVLSDGNRIATYDGDLLTPIDANSWTTPDGRTVYVYNPTVSNAPVSAPAPEYVPEETVKYLSSPAGDTGVEIHKGADGNWYDNNGDSYYANEAGVWYNNNNGTEWW